MIYIFWKLSWFSITADAFRLTYFASVVQAHSLGSSKDRQSNKCEKRNLHSYENLTSDS